MKNINEKIEEMYSDDRFVGFIEYGDLMIIGDAKDVLSMVKRSVYFLEKLNGINFELYTITPSLLAEKFNEYVGAGFINYGHIDFDKEKYVEIILSKGFINMLKEKDYTFVFRNFFTYGDISYEESLRLSLLYPTYKLQEIYGINE